MVNNPNSSGEYIREITGEKAIDNNWAITVPVINFTMFFENSDRFLFPGLSGNVLILKNELVE
jgi:hypothetical protein